MRRLLHYAFFFTILLSGSTLRASHLYGADFFYEHIKDTTYKVTLVMYGDCSGASFANGFNNATPQIRLERSGNFVRSFSLSLDTAGLEVTPVCAAQKANTACVSTNATIPGIKRYRYSATISLPNPYRASNWLFRFEGNMGNGISGAGRSNSITSIYIPSGNNGGSLMTLEASLNNSTTNNSSPTFTTIPTPFFCANVAQQYNQGAVDPNGDVLIYSLTDGLEPAQLVTYNSGYSATSPIMSAAGTFSFNTSTGQLAFTPSIAQRCLVVNKVEEYRGGVLVGTSMREMTFVVLSGCNNTPAYSAIDSTTAGSNIGGVPSSPSTYNVCQGADSIRFHILPLNPGNDTIYASVQGLPAGATATILQDSTTRPDIIINWKTPNLAPGNYNFFVTYKDNSCPLSSTQTQAYTVQVIRRNEMAIVIAAPTQCVHQALVKYSFLYGLLPRTVSISQGNTVIHSYIDNSGALTDSLAAGLYSVTITSAKLPCPTTYQLRIVDSGVYPNKPITTPKFYCFGDPSQLLTAGYDSGAYLNWYNAAGTLLPGPPLPRTDTVGIFTYFTAQRYKVCTSLKDSVNVYVTKRPIASISGPSTLCSGDTGVFLFNGTIGVGPILEYTWDWDMASFASGTDGGPYRVHWNVPGTKTIKLQVAENKCVSAVTTHDVSVKPTPYAGFNYPVQGVCQYDTTHLIYNSRPYPGQKYAWSFAGAAVEQDLGPKLYILRWDTAGIKRITLTVDLDGCTDTRIADIVVHPIPMTRIANVAGPVCIGDKIFVQAVADDATFAWQPSGDFLIAPDGRPYFQILKPSVYKVYATSSFGCKDSAAITYDNVQPCCEFSYPDAFTPNNDGHNDRYRVVAYGNQLEYALSIYNRWGQRVYYGLDPKSGWDGTVNNDGGTKCDAGTYFYYLTAKCFTGHVEEHKGELLLIR